MLPTASLDCLLSESVKQSLEKSGKFDGPIAINPTAEFLARMGVGQLQVDASVATLLLVLRLNIISVYIIYIYIIIHYLTG